MIQLFDMVVFFPFFVFFFSLKLTCRVKKQRNEGGRSVTDKIKNKGVNKVLELKFMCSLAIRLWQQNDTVAKNKALDIETHHLRRHRP